MNDAAARASRLTADRSFYWITAAAIAVIGFIGFAPTYYLSALFVPRHWPPLVHLHAALFTAWLGVLVVQAVLVGVGRVQFHRRLGTFAVLLALAMLPVGIHINAASIDNE